MTLTLPISRGRQHDGERQLSLVFTNKKLKIMETIKIRKNIVSNGMEEMRSQFVTLLNEKQIEFDKTCIKQSKADLGKGIIVATLKGEQVGAIYWLRSTTEEGKKQYAMLTTRSANEQDFSEYDNDNTPAKPAKKQKNAKKDQEEVAVEDAENTTTDETEEAPQEQEAAE